MLQKSHFILRQKRINESTQKCCKERAKEEHSEVTSHYPGVQEKAKLWVGKKCLLPRPKTNCDRTVLTLQIVHCSSQDMLNISNVLNGYLQDAMGHKLYQLKAMMVMVTDSSREPSNLHSVTRQSALLISQNRGYSSHIFGFSPQKNFEGYSYQYYRYPQESQSEWKNTQHANSTCLNLILFHKFWGGRA